MKEEKGSKKSAEKERDQLYKKVGQLQIKLDFLKKAINEHGAPEIMNSDQGVQFTSEAYLAVLKAQDVKISMDGKAGLLIIFSLNG